MTPYLAPSLQPLAVVVVAPLIPLREITAVLAAAVALMRRLLRGRVVRGIHPALRRRKVTTVEPHLLILTHGPVAAAVALQQLAQTQQAELPVTAALVQRRAAQLQRHRRTGGR